MFLLEKVIFSHHLQRLPKFGQVLDYNLFLRVMIVVKNSYIGLADLFFHNQKNRGKLKWCVPMEPISRKAEKTKYLRFYLH